jgi:hypothetical protein
VYDSIQRRSSSIALQSTLTHPLSIAGRFNTLESHLDAFGRGYHVLVDLLL